MAVLSSVRLNLGLRRTPLWQAFETTPLYDLLEDIEIARRERQRVEWERKNLTISEASVEELFPGLLADGIRIVDWPRVQRNMGQDELMLLCQLTRYLKPQVVLEIGTFDGRTTKNIACNLPEGGVVVTVDIDPAAGSRFRGTFHESRIRQVTGDSRLVDFEQSIRVELGRQYVDLAIIDGLHAQDAVESDTANCLRLINPERGVILWHDYEYYEYKYGDQVARCDVPLFLNWLSSNHRLFHIKGTSFVVYFANGGTIPVAMCDGRHMIGTR